MGAWGEPVVVGKRQGDRASDVAAGGALTAGGGLGAMAYGAQIPRAQASRARAAEQSLTRQQIRHGQIAGVGMQARTAAASAHQASLKAIKDGDATAAHNLRHEEQTLAQQSRTAAQHHKHAEQYVARAKARADEAKGLIPAAQARGKAVRAIGRKVAIGGAAVAAGAGVLAEVRRSKEKAAGWQPPEQESHPFKGTTDMDVLAARARRARMLGMGSHGSAADDEIAPGVAQRVTSYGKAAGDWKTIDQRQDSQYRARRWKRRGIAAATLGGSAALGQEIAAPGSAASARGAVSAYRTAAGRLDAARSVYGRKDMDPGLTKPRLARGIAARASTPAKILAGGTALAAGGAATALGARAAESYQQRRINERRKANVVRRKS